MKKKSSTNDIILHASLFGIVANIKDFKLAFLINKLFNIELEKKDYEYSEDTLQHKIIFYFASDFYFEYYLFKNEFHAEFFQKKFKNIDFFLLLKPIIPSAEMPSVVNPLLKLSEVSACVQVPDEKTILEVLKLLRLVE